MPTVTDVFFSLVPMAKHRPIRLGKMPKKDAERIKLKVEILAAAQITNHPVDVEISKWVAGIGDDLYDKLAAVKLLPQRSHATVNLHDFITLYIDGRTDIKQATRIGLLQAQTRLVDFFGKGIDLRQFTQADADRWVIHLRAKYAEATAAQTIKRARQFFTAAKRAKKIQDNPFDGIKPGRMENPEKLLPVSRRYREDPRSMPFSALACNRSSMPMGWAALSVRSG